LTSPGGTVLPGFRNPIVVLALLIVVSVIGLIAAAVLGVDRGVLRDMASPEYARGLITFLFAVVTIGTALVLVVSALIGSDSEASEKQFQHGKEMFSLLLGVFGTVVGYYFGSAHAGTAISDLKVSEIMVLPEMPHAGQEITIRALIVGGVCPCEYAVTLGSGTPKASTDVPENGLIATQIALPASPASPEVPIQLRVNDSTGREVNQKTQLRLVSSQ
jgi:hypothetical protein